MTSMRSQAGLTRSFALCELHVEVNALYPGAFPYSFDFLYWEEACSASNAV